MFTVLAHHVAHSFSTSAPTHKSTPVLHRISHRFFPFISHVVDLDIQFDQDRVDLQRLRDRLGTVVADVGVEAQVQVGQDPIENA